MSDAADRADIQRALSEVVRAARGFRKSVDRYRERWGRAPVEPAAEGSGTVPTANPADIQRIIGYLKGEKWGR